MISEKRCHSSGSWSSAKQASTGQASTQASQSMHSSGSMKSMLHLVVVRLLRGRVDAVDRAHLDARVVLRADARLGDDVGHCGWVPRCGAVGGRAGSLPNAPRYAPPPMLLLTGATGVVGRALLQRLVAAGDAGPLPGARPAPPRARPRPRAARPRRPRRPAVVPQRPARGRASWSTWPRPCATSPARRSRSSTASRPGASSRPPRGRAPQRFVFLSSRRGDEPQPRALPARQGRRRARGARVAGPLDRRGAVARRRPLATASPRSCGAWRCCPPSRSAAPGAPSSSRSGPVTWRPRSRRVLERGDDAPARVELCGPAAADPRRGRPRRAGRGRAASARSSTSRPPVARAALRAGRGPPAGPRPADLGRGRALRGQRDVPARHGGRARPGRVPVRPPTCSRWASAGRPRARPR